MRHGFTLIEVAAVVTVLSVLALIATPRFLAVADGAAVRDETGRLVLALDAARGAARRLGTAAQLTLSDSCYLVTGSVDTEAVIAWRAAGPGSAGVALTGAGSPIVFGPAGVAMGVSNRTLVLSRGRAERRIVISRLGRLTY